MGFNTTVFILNDCMHVLREHPKEFVDSIFTQMNRGGDVSPRNHIGYGKVMKTAHADVPRLYFTHGNSIIELSRWEQETIDLYKRDEIGKNFVRSSLKEAESMLKELKKHLNSIDNANDLIERAKK